MTPEEEAGGMGEPMKTVGTALIVGLVRAWAERESRTAEEAGELLNAICSAMLSPRERAQRVDRAIVRRAAL